ncbi:MAG: (2Fe-2S)-binding protein [Nitrosomonas sp.]|nr:MAG: (2Fe-2S)-binding protein [Nitrosomonas sp.]
MYVCVCKGVTDKALREAIHQGADRMRDLKTCLGVTEQCGICACHVKEILDQTLQERSQTLQQTNQVQGFISRPVCLCGEAA